MSSCIVGIKMKEKDNEKQELNFVKNATSPSESKLNYRRWPQTVSITFDTTRLNARCGQYFIDFIILPGII